MYNGIVESYPTVKEIGVTLTFTNGDATSNIGGDTEVIGAYHSSAAYIFQPYFKNADGKWHFFVFYFSSTTAVNVLNGELPFVVQTIPIS